MKSHCYPDPNFNRSQGTRKHASKTFKKYKIGKVRELPRIRIHLGKRIERFSWRRWNANWALKFKMHRFLLKNMILSTVSKSMC